MIINVIRGKQTTVTSYGRFHWVRNWFKIHWWNALFYWIHNQLSFAVNVRLDLVNWMPSLQVSEWCCCVAGIVMVFSVTLAAYYRLTDSLICIPIATWACYKRRPEFCEPFVFIQETSRGITQFIHRLSDTAE